MHAVGDRDTTEEDDLFEELLDFDEEDDDEDEDEDDEDPDEWNFSRFVH